jgi:hypothetical protein
MLRILLFIALPFAGGPVAAQVVINEVCPRNYSNFEDEHGRHPDWVELFNHGPEPVDLAGHHLSDRAGDPFKWVLPDVVLGPGEFILFKSGPAHLGDHFFQFGISAEGEAIYLSDPQGTLLDQLMVPPLHADHSYGRTPAGMRYFDIPTPGLPNPVGHAGYAATPVAYPPPGIHAGSLNVTLSAEDPVTIHYTTDGSLPDLSSPIANASIPVPVPMAIRAIATAPDMLPSLVTTASYLVGIHHQLPVVSISVDPDSMFHEEFGIVSMGPNADTVPPYWGANFWENRYIPAHLEYFEGGQLRITQDLDLRMHGGTSARTRPQRPMRLTGRNKYGRRHIVYPIFPERPEGQRFKQLVLRNSGGDFCLANFRDGLFHQTALHHALDIDALGFKPAATYINGQYWGIMNIRERIQPENIALAHGLDRHAILLGNGENESMQGDTLPFHELQQYIRSQDMNDPVHFQHADSLLDLSSFKDYFILQMFAGNVDWPSNNIRFWKPSVASGKWRYLLHDLDATMQAAGYIPMDVDMFHWVLVHRAGWMHSEIFRSLLKNDEFRRTFINRFADLLNTAFKPAAFQQEVDLITGRIQAEIPRHFSRWGQWTSIWEEHARVVIPEFARVRPGHVRDHIVNEFGLAGGVRLTFDVFPADGGSLVLNTITPPAPFEGIYFNGNEIDLGIVVKEGFTFDHWEFPDEPVKRGTEPWARMNFTSNGTITAVLRQEGDGLQVWPNPVSDEAMASFNAAGSGEATIAVYDMNGRMIHREQRSHHDGTNRIRLQLNFIPSGVFILAATVEGVRHTARLVKVTDTSR